MTKFLYKFKLHVQVNLSKLLRKQHPSFFENRKANTKNNWNNNDEEGKAVSSMSC